MPTIQNIIDFFVVTKDFWYFILGIIGIGFVYGLFIYIWDIIKERYPLFIQTSLIILVSILTFIFLSPLYLIVSMIALVGFFAWIFIEKNTIRKDAPEILNTLTLMEENITNIIKTRTGEDSIGREVFGNNMRYYYHRHEEDDKIRYVSCAEGKGGYSGFFLRSFYDISDGSIERMVWWRDGAGWRAQSLYHIIKGLRPNMTDQRLMSRFLEHTGDLKKYKK